MNLFSKYSLVVGLGLLCVIIGCGETEDPLHPIDINDKDFRTVAETKIPPLTGVRAAPQAPPTDGTPFVRSVTYYTDWKLTEPITGTVSPGTTFFTKIVFSEPMTFNVADDKTARPILYYQIDGKRTRYRVAAHGARGEAFESGDAKSKGSGTQTFVCKYTVPAEMTGTFKTAIGKLSTDKDGNSLAGFYVHTDALRFELPRSADIHLSKMTFHIFPKTLVLVIYASNKNYHAEHNETNKNPVKFGIEVDMTDFPNHLSDDFSFSMQSGVAFATQCYQIILCHQMC